MPLTGAQFHHLLQMCPQSVTWSAPPEFVTLRKTPTGSLGLKIKTFPHETCHGPESTTIVRTILPQCTVLKVGILREYDRIVSLDGKDTVNISEKEVSSFIREHSKETIQLGVCHLLQLPEDRIAIKTGGDRHQRSQVSKIATSNALQRLHSRTSSDSGRGSSPRSGGTDGSFDFEIGLQDIPSANCSLNSSGHSLDNSIVSSKQTVSVKRSASGSSSCGQAHNQSGQRKRFSSKHSEPCLGQQSSHSHRGSCSLCLSQHTVCAPTVNFIPQCELYYQGVNRQEYTNSANSVPQGFTLSDIQLWDNAYQTWSLPLPSELTASKCCPEHSCACRGQSYHSVVNFSDMSFESGQSPCNKHITGGNKSSSKVLPTNAKGSKGACSDCVSIAQQILTDPQNVLWDPNTKVINLERSNRKTPLGITFKVRQCKNEDGTADLYTLVEQVRKGGLAEGKLMVGDWIRSIDGNPLHDVKEALGITKLLDKRESMRFVIQRPVDMREKTIVTEERSRKHGNYTPSTSPPFGEPPDSFPACGVCTHQDQSASAPPRPAQPSNKPPKMERYFSTSSHSSNTSGRRHSPRTPPVCTCTNAISNSYLRSVSTVWEPDWVTMARSSSMTENVKFPSMQLFVAGSHASKMTELLLSTCSNRQPLCIAPKEKFLHIRCYVSEEADGVTKLYLRDDVSYSENDILNHVISPCFDGQNSVCADDIELDVSTQCGSDPQSRCYSRQTSRSQNSTRCVIALDIFVINDEKFFSQCCHILFSKNSLFFLTFDGSKVLESTSEMTKIGQMVHSARAASGVDTPLYLYGFLHGETAEYDSPKADELNALFYTYHGRQILRYTNVGMPQFIVLQPPGGPVEDQGYGARQLIGQIVLHQDFLAGQLHLGTLSVMSWISKQRQSGRCTVQLRELKEAIISLLPECHLVRIINELQGSGTIRLTGDGDWFASAPEDRSVLIQPAVLPLWLNSLVSGLEKSVSTNRASPRKTTPGIKFPTAVTENMLKAALDIIDFPKMATCEMIPFLENYLALQNVWVATDIYLIPYFCQETLPQGEDWEHKEDFVLYVKLEKVIQTGVFFRCVNALAEHCQATELSALSLYTANLTLEDWSIFLQHLWKEDCIQISIRSTKVNLPSSPPRGFVNQLSKACRTSLPSSTEFHISVPCPLEEDCQTDKGTQPHLVDIQQEPLLCGNIRVDTKKAVKIWLCTLSSKPKPSSNGAGQPPEDPPSPKEKRFDWSMQVLTLPYSLLHKLFLQLRVPMTTGNDWTGFAGCIGKTGLEVALYETQKNPPKELITEWARLNRATVRDLVDVLSHPDMDRKDLVDMITQTINLT